MEGGEEEKVENGETVCMSPKITKRNIKCIAQRNFHFYILMLRLWWWWQWLWWWWSWLPLALIVAMTEMSSEWQIKCVLRKTSYFPNVPCVTVYLGSSLEPLEIWLDIVWKSWHLYYFDDVDFTKTWMLVSIAAWKNKQIFTKLGCLYLG